MTTMTVKLTRTQSQPWGFRLQGGKDFNAPLALQKVTSGSLAEKAGLEAGDAILKINDVSVDALRHKEAQDALVRAGNHFELTVQRGGMRIWKPSVTTVTSTETTTSSSSSQHHLISNERPVTPVTKTSLAAKPQEVRNVGAAHNLKPKPFGQQNGDGLIPSLVHKQYNSPAPLYSMQNIADTLTAQAEVLSTGAVGYNFMKNPTPVNKESAVYRACLEDQTAPPPEKPQTPVYDDSAFARSQQLTQDIQSRSFKVLQKSLNDDGEEPAHPLATALRHVEPPKPAAPKDPSAEGPKTGDNLCGECGRLIVGVFVRIKEKNLHADCFKCTTCGSSLRNVGYYNINDKLYCDVHARLVAKHAATLPGPIVQSLGSPSISSSSTTKEVHIVGVSSQGPPASSPFSPSSSAYTPFHSVKPSATTPISVDTSSVRHLQSSTTDAHKQFTGGSKFTWPPKPSDSSAAAETTTAVAAESVAAIDTSLSPTMPSYRAPPSTQHVQFTSAKFKQPAHSSSSFTHSSSITSSTGTTTHHVASSSTHHVASSSATHHGAYSPSYSPLIPAKTSLPSVPSAAVGPSCSSPTPCGLGLAHVAGPKPFSPLTVSAKPVAAPSGPLTPSSAWVPTSPIGAMTKPIPTAPTAGSRPAPRRGRGILNPASAPGGRVPVCATCGTPIRGPFVTALGKTWCHNHFHCVNAQCRRPLQDIGFVEEQGQLYCEICYETYLAPVCNKCTARIKGDCLNAIGKQWHPDCFVCSYCRQAFGNSHFYLEDGLPYCEKDWNELFTTKCVGCGFPIEAGDRWVEALNSNYHSQCFKCTICHKNLEGQSFYAKGGRPFCKNHAR